MKREGSSHHDGDPNNLVTAQLQASIGRPSGGKRPSSHELSADSHATRGSTLHNSFLPPFVPKKRVE